MRTIRLAITGFGNVGTGIAILLRDRGQEYRERYGLELMITGVADRGGAVTHPDGLDPADLLSVKREQATVAESSLGHVGLRGERFLDLAAADVLLETASTSFEDAEPGWSYVRQALRRDMDVVLASKGALALYWDQLTAEARENGRIVNFSATVGAPLPAVEIARWALPGVAIRGFEGILNGTSNTILTLMAQGATYEEGVQRAQEIGIAETDPTLDVDGWDAAAKVVIVANAVLGCSLRLDDVRREGIRNITRKEIQSASEEGQVIKLIARAMRTPEGLRAEVAPQRRSHADSLGRLHGGDIGIVFVTDLYGDVSATVENADHQGAIPTSMTVLRDVINLARERSWTSE
ncbi:MAG: homoserine dehydrogenase [Chloroflexota bacterium]